PRRLRRRAVALLRRLGPPDRRCGTLERPCLPATPPRAALVRARGGRSATLPAALSARRTRSGLRRVDTATSRQRRTGATRSRRPSTCLEEAFMFPQIGSQTVIIFKHLQFLGPWKRTFPLYGTMYEALKSAQLVVVEEIAAGTNVTSWFKL